MIREKILRQLYCDQKLSMVEVAGRLNTTPSTVGYWLKKHDIPRRSWSESSYAKQNPDGDPFKIKKDLKRKEKELLTAGLMLYLGEGGKARHSIQLGNLDPTIIQIFLKFLKEVCQIKENKIRLYVRLHKKFNMANAKVYWSKELKIPKEQVMVYTHNDPRSKAEKQWSQYGIATLQFNNIKLKRWLNDKLKGYKKNLLR